MTQATIHQHSHNHAQREPSPHLEKTKPRRGPKGKLTDDQVRMVREVDEDGYPLYDAYVLAERFGVSTQLIYRTRRCQAYPQVH